MHVQQPLGHVLYGNTVMYVYYMLLLFKNEPVLTFLYDAILLTYFFHTDM